MEKFFSQLSLQKILLLLVLLTFSGCELDFSQGYTFVYSRPEVENPEVENPEVENPEVENPANNGVTYIEGYVGSCEVIIVDGDIYIDGRVFSSASVYASGDIYIDGHVFSFASVYASGDIYIGGNTCYGSVVKSDGGNIYITGCVGSSSTVNSVVGDVYVGDLIIVYSTVTAGGKIYNDIQYNDTISAFGEELLKKYQGRQ